MIHFTTLVIVGFLATASKAAVIPDACNIVNVLKWDSWEQFNPLTTADADETNVYKVARCTNGKPITSLPANIEVLYISSNDFTDPRFSLAGILRTLPNLIAVAIDLCDLSRQTTNELFSKNPKLQYLSITQCASGPGYPVQNMLTENVELEVLKLASSGIIDIPSTLLRTNVKLQKVDFSQNHISQIPGDIFAANPSLEIVSLHSNVITSLPPRILNDLHRLEEFDASGNTLTTLAGHLFDENTALTKVNLRANSITSIPAHLFAHSSHLRVVYFTNNKLEKIPREFFLNCPRLYVANFDHNAIPTRGIPDDLFSHNEEIFFVDFRGNAGMLPELGVQHHGIPQIAMEMISEFGYNESDEFGN